MKVAFLMLLAVFVLFMTSCDDSGSATVKDTSSQMTIDTSSSTAGNGGSDDSGSSLESYTDLSASEVHALMETGEHVVVVDVSPFYDDGHIPGSINFYVGSSEIDTALPLIDKSFTYVIYCHNDVASMQGAQRFVDAGFGSVHRLEGNFSAWLQAGYSEQLTESGYMDLSPATAKVLRDGNPNVVTIDVSPYYDNGHLPNSVSLPLSDGSLEAAVSSFDSANIYLVYCHGDAPSISASGLIFDAGFLPVYRLEGNYNGWVNAGFPVE